MENGFHIDAASGTHEGGRDFQEDRVALLEHPRYLGCVLGIVADGMGGLTGGRKAADQVILTATQLFERFAPKLDDAVALLRQISMESHKVIKLTAMAAEQQPHSTIAAFLTTPTGECHWIHAGDSRIYQFRDRELIRQSTDHSYVQELVARGELTADQAAAHPQSNILTSCLGTEDDPVLETCTIQQLQIGDTILACSDGLWHYVTGEELGLIVQALAPRDACQVLIEKAGERSRGHGDNLSVIIAKVGPFVGKRRDENCANKLQFPASV